MGELFEIYNRVENINLSHFILFKNCIVGENDPDFVFYVWGLISNDSGHPLGSNFR